MPQVISAAEIAWDIIKVAIVVGSIIYSQQQARKLKNALKSLTSTQSSAQGRNITSRDSAAYHQIVYGECRVGGTVIFNSNTGPNSEYKHLVIVMAGHEVDGFHTLQLDDEIVELTADGRAIGHFAGYLRAYFFTGAQDQAVIPMLAAECPDLWDASHKLSGLAGVYIGLTVNSDLFPNGVPNITAICRGKKLFDPRTGLTAWSNNAALCLADYYCDKKHGLGFDMDTEIDIPELIASANVCDEQIPVNPRPTS
jgi:hypothetical protein